MADRFWMGTNNPKGENHYKYWETERRKLFERFDSHDLTELERAQIHATHELEEVHRRVKRMGAQLVDGRLTGLLLRKMTEVSVAQPGDHCYPKKKVIQAPTNSRNRGNQSQAY